MGRNRCRRGRPDQGFSLIELGIVIAVVAILAGVVIAGQGFITASKVRTTIDLVFTIKKAAQQYAQRHQHGLAYGTSSNPDDPNNVNIGGLRSENFLPTNLATPWETGPSPNDIVVFPNNSANAQICGGYACVEIQMQIGPSANCQDLSNGISPQAVSVTCNIPLLDVVMR